MSKKAVLVVGFGTRYESALKAIENIEKHVREGFPDYDFFRVFTSDYIIKRLARDQGKEIMNVEAAFTYLRDNGYEELVVQPTYINQGEEYTKIAEDFSQKSRYFKSFKIGKPLLSTEEDLEEIAGIIMRQLPEKLDKDQAFILMGHGSKKAPNTIYVKVQEVFQKLGYDQTYLATLDGEPGFGTILPKLTERVIKKAYLMPFMVSAGDHAAVDMAGDGENSWKNLLKAAGIDPVPMIRGLGEIDEAAKMYVAHAKDGEELVR